MVLHLSLLLLHGQLLIGQHHFLMLVLLDWELLASGRWRASCLVGQYLSGDPGRALTDADLRREWRQLHWLSEYIRRCIDGEVLIHAVALDLRLFALNGAGLLAVNRVGHAL